MEAVVFANYFNISTWQGSHRWHVHIWWCHCQRQYRDRNNNEAIGFKLSISIKEGRIPWGIGITCYSVVLFAIMYVHDSKTCDSQWFLEYKDIWKQIFSTKPHIVTE